jgi:hypothetical protein
MSDKVLAVRLSGQVCQGILCGPWLLPGEEGYKRDSHRWIHNITVVSEPTDTTLLLRISEDGTIIDDPGKIIERVNLQRRKEYWKEASQYDRRSVQKAIRNHKVWWDSFFPLKYSRRTLRACRRIEGTLFPINPHIFIDNRYTGGSISQVPLDFS